MPLLSTKTYIPQARQDVIQRPHLVEKLLIGACRPATLLLLSSPAGFGKTTLLSQFIAQLQLRAAWVSLEEADNDPIRFWSYVIAACQSVQKNIGETALVQLHSPQPLPEELVSLTLINEFFSLSSELVLVLDDYHTIHNQSIHAAIATLLDHMPEKLRLAVSTRIDPPWPVARLRARNRLVEIRAADLRFSTEEAAAFLNRTMGLKLPFEAIEIMETRTEGWAAGLQLAAIAMQSPETVKAGKDATSFINDFSGSNIFVADYLVEEVLQRQPEELQTFLLQTSILERLTARLCEAVTGQQDGQVTLAALQRANLFLLPLDNEGEWFRYHHLFADLLRARLRQKFTPETVFALHQRASYWFEQAGMVEDAVEHALAATDYPFVVRMVEKLGLPMILQAYIRTVESWLQAIPQKYLSQSAKANMAYAWMNLLRGTMEQAKPYIDQVNQLISASDSSDLDNSLRGEWLAIQSKILSIEGKPAECRDMAKQALQLLTDADVTVRSMVLVNLATAYQQMLDYDGAAETFRKIVFNARSMGDHISETLGISGQAQMMLQQGRLHTSFELASEGIKRLEAAGKTTPFSATLFGELGLIYYHWHHLDQAQSFLQRSIQASGQSGYSDPEIYKHVMLSRMSQMEENWEVAAQEMQHANDLARKIPPAMIREEIISQQVRVELALNRCGAAQALLKPEGFSFEEGLVYPELTNSSGKGDRPVTHPVGILYNSALRVLLYMALNEKGTVDLKTGVELAGRVLDGELKCRHLPSGIETLLLRAQIYRALGDEETCLADVVRALELAEPERFISIFVEEGRPVAEALSSILRRNLHGTVLPAYILEILASFPAKAHAQAAGHKLPLSKKAPGLDEFPAPVETLTTRELEVLQLIAAGDSNSTIAEKLVITISAVKKHTSNIFGKLSVNSRTQAVVRAHQLNLLPPN